MSSLPKPGTKIEDLKCLKCRKTLGEVMKETPVGQVDCSNEECPQKPVNPPTL